jgi:hypothetical protein
MTVAAILDEVESAQDRRLSLSVSISAAPEAI